MVYILLGLIVVIFVEFLILNLIEKRDAIDDYFGDDVHVEDVFEDETKSKAKIIGTYEDNPSFVKIREVKPKKKIKLKIRIKKKKSVPSGYKYGDLEDDLYDIMNDDEDPFDFDTNKLIDKSKYEEEVI